MKTKTLDDVQQDMSDLYEQLKSGQIQSKDAAELANIAGKYLKAEQLKLAREIFIDQIEQRISPLSIAPKRADATDILSS